MVDVSTSLTVHFWASALCGGHIVFTVFSATADCTSLLTQASIILSEYPVLLRRSLSLAFSLARLAEPQPALPLSPGRRARVLGLACARDLARTPCGGGRFWSYFSYSYAAQQYV